MNPTMSRLHYQQVTLAYKSVTLTTDTSPSPINVHEIVNGRLTRFETGK